MAIDIRQEARSSGRQAREGDDQPTAEKESAGHTERDRLGSYTVLVGGYAAALGAFLFASRRRLPEAISAGDLALIGVATHKTSRAIGKDKVTAPLRAPFTEHQGQAGPGELEESPRGSGLRHVIGELLVCPFCLDQWVATGYAAGLVTAPRVTRFVAGIMATVAVSDFLQIGYMASESRLGD
jgi:hypothetical protein